MFYLMATPSQQAMQSRLSWVSHAAKAIIPTP
jgi:hypothetical protein